LAAFGANHHLRQSLVFLNMPVMQQPEVYISKVGDAFDENGTLDGRTRKFLQQAISEYIAWFSKNI
jgi:chromate reductase